MKEMKGSEKQIAWATEIREYVVNEIMAGIEIAELSDKNMVKVEMIKTELENDDAKFWIDTFKCTNWEKAKHIFEYLNEKGIAGMKIARAINKIHGNE